MNLLKKLKKTNRSGIREYTRKVDEVMTGLLANYPDYQCIGLKTNIHFPFVFIRPTAIKQLDQDNADTVSL